MQVNGFKRPTGVLKSSRWMSPKMSNDFKFKESDRQQKGKGKGETYESERTSVRE